MSYIVRIPLLQMNDNIFLHFFKGLIWLYLRIPACARWGTMSYIVKSPSLQISSIFVGVFSGRI